MECTLARTTSLDTNERNFSILLSNDVIVSRILYACVDIGWYPASTQQFGLDRFFPIRTDGLMVNSIVLIHRTHHRAMLFRCKRVNGHPGRPNTCISSVHSRFDIPLEA